MPMDGPDPDQAYEIERDNHAIILSCPRCGGTCPPRRDSYCQKLGFPATDERFDS